MKTDSNFESNLITKHGIKLNHGQFKQTFYDKDKFPFNAKYDSVVEFNDEQYYIEFKQHTLNNKTSVGSCYNKLFEQCKWHNLPIENLSTINHNSLSSLLWTHNHPADCLVYAWNHAAQKHSIIAKEYGNNYIVVFDKHPATVMYRKKSILFQQYYKQRYGIRTMLLSEFKDKFFV